MKEYTLANMAKDNGIVVLGEQAGGGACSPQITPEPDYVLTKVNGGDYDYSLFADFVEISRMIDEYYK